MSDSSTDVANPVFSAQLLSVTVMTLSLSLKRVDSVLCSTAMTFKKHRSVNEKNETGERSKVVFKDIVVSCFIVYDSYVTGRSVSSNSRSYRASGTLQAFLL